jgi:hypothetical protein
MKVISALDFQPANNSRDLPLALRAKMLAPTAERTQLVAFKSFHEGSGRVKLNEVT